MKLTVIFLLGSFMFQAQANDLSQVRVRCTIRNKVGTKLVKTQNYRGNIFIGLRENGPVQLDIKPFILSDLAIANYGFLAKNYHFKDNVITARESVSNKGITWKKAMSIAENTASLSFSREYADPSDVNFSPQNTTNISCALNEPLDVDEINEKIQDRIREDNSRRHRRNSYHTNRGVVSGSVTVDDVQSKLNEAKNKPLRRR